MSHERGMNKKRKEEKKIERIARLAGIDLCACGGSDKLKCHGVCRERHLDKQTGYVNCEELYQVKIVSQKKDRKPKKDWKYGRQKEGNENQRSKQNRRNKLNRETN